jgi:hypothetical protein
MHNQKTELQYSKRIKSNRYEKDKVDQDDKKKIGFDPG